MSDDYKSLLNNQAEDGYTGDDYVKIALMYHENPWDSYIETTGYVEINFRIVEN